MNERLDKLAGARSLTAMDAVTSAVDATRDFLGASRRPLSRPQTVWARADARLHHDSQAQHRGPTPGSHGCLISMPSSRKQTYNALRAPDSAGIRPCSHVHSEAPAARPAAGAWRRPASPRKVRRTREPYERDCGTGQTPAVLRRDQLGRRFCGVGRERSQLSAKQAHIATTAAAKLHPGPPSGAFAQAG